MFKVLLSCILLYGCTTCNPTMQFSGTLNPQDLTDISNFQPGIKCKF